MGYIPPFDAKIIWCVTSHKFSKKIFNKKNPPFKSISQNDQNTTQYDQFIIIHTLKQLKLNDLCKNLFPVYISTAKLCIFNVDLLSL